MSEVNGQWWSQFEWRATGWHRLKNGENSLSGLVNTTICRIWVTCLTWVNQAHMILPLNGVRLLTYQVNKNGGIRAARSFKWMADPVQQAKVFDKLCKWIVNAIKRIHNAFPALIVSNIYHELISLSVIKNV